MSAITRVRRNRIIAGVIVIGLLTGLAEVIAYEIWTEWQEEVFTPLSFQVMLLAFGVAVILDGEWNEAILLFPLGVLLFLAASFIALAPLLVPASMRELWARLILILVFFISAIGWKSNWPLLQWGPRNSWRMPLACVSAGLASLSLIGYAFWRRNPDGRAAFWYPAILQVWIQSLWIPWPDDD